MTETEPAAFSELLRRYRFSAGLTQEALAERAGLSVRGIQDLERGVTHPPRTPSAAPVRRGSGPPARTFGSASRHNLPTPMTSFVGRKDGLADLRRLLSSTRLLTLTGAGGCGKTRLALQAASALVPAFEDGVWLIELAGLSEPAHVPRAVMSALGLREASIRPPTAIVQEYLQDRRTLLVLDNREHLVATCADLVASLLRHCPHLRILATSRERLRITGEAEWRVPSLSVPFQRTATGYQPEPKRPASLDELSRYESVRLFVDRARAVQPAFEITSQIAPALTELCARLDGIPLTIELAAARVRHMSLAQLASRLDDRFALLTGGGRDDLPRHQTLRATLDWSYDLLTEAERMVLRRLSVFAGGFSLEAAEAVCADATTSGVPQTDVVTRSDVLKVVTQLVDKSLVEFEESTPDSRYRLLETVRQYAAGKLELAGEVEARRRHRDWYVALAEQARFLLESPNQRAWIDRLETEHDNFRAALAWCEQDPSEGVAMLQMSAALSTIWNIGVHVGEGRVWLDRALSVGNEAPASLRARAMLGAGFLASRVSDARREASMYESAARLFGDVGDERGLADSALQLGHAALERSDYAEAYSRMEQGLLLAQHLGDDSLIARARWHLGRPLVEQGRYAEARAVLQPSLDSYQSTGDIGREASVLNWLGEVDTCEGDFVTAHVRFERSLQLFQEARDAPGVAWSLRNLGRLAYLEGDLAKAGERLERALEIQRAVGANHRSIVEELGFLGAVKRKQGDAEAARSRYLEGMEVSLKIGWKRGVAECLERLAGLATDGGEPARRARLFGAAEALRGAISAPMPPPHRPDYERDVAALRASMTEAQCSSCWAAGQAMTLEQAVSAALDAPER